MIIEKLCMENFKSHMSTQIDFSTGISMIIGENGAGKSSILEAVSFALFKQHSGKKVEHLIKNNTFKMKVELDFIANGRAYKVLREYRALGESGKFGSKSKLKIKEEDRYHTLFSKDKQVTNEIQRILEMDSDLFMNAIYVRQGEISNLIEKSPAEKKQMIGRLLGIESLEKAWKNMLTLINKYDKERIKIEGRLESLKDVRKDIKSKNKELRQIKVNIDELNRKIEEINIELGTIREEKEILDKKKSRFEKTLTQTEAKNELLNKLKKSKDELKNEKVKIENKEKEMDIINPKISKLKLLNQLKEALENLTHLKADEKHFNNLLTDINKFKKILADNQQFYNNYSFISEKIHSLEEEREEFEGSRALMKQHHQIKEETIEKISRSQERIIKVLKESNEALGTDFHSIEEIENYLETKKPEKEREIEEIINQINHVNEKISNLSVQNSDLKKPIKELEMVKDKCPVCKSTITPEKRHDLINEYFSQIEENKEIILKFNVQLDELLSKKEILNSDFEKMKRINVEMLKENLKTLKKSRKELEAINSDIKQLDGKISILDDIDGKIKKNKIIKTEIKDKYESYISARGSLESLGDPDDHMIRLREIKSSMVSLEEHIDNLIRKSGVSLKNFKAEIANLEELSKKFERLKGAISQKDSLIQRLNETEKTISETQEELSSLSVEIKNINYDEVYYDNLKQNLETNNQKLIKFIGRKQELIGKESEISRVVMELEVKLESYNKFGKELRNISDFIKLLNLIRDLYGKDGVQKELRNNSRERIEQETRNFFEQFNFEYFDIKLDENYDVTVYGPSGNNSLDMMSGGEKIAVAIALRLGITQTISRSNLELIMLDEPTVHLDSYRIQELIELLKKMSIIPQMIIVTHDTDLEEAADNIFRIEKKDGKSVLVS